MVAACWKLPIVSHHLESPNLRFAGMVGNVHLSTIAGTVSPWPMYGQSPLSKLLSSAKVAVPRHLRKVHVHVTLGAQGWSPYVCRRQLSPASVLRDMCVATPLVNALCHQLLKSMEALHPRQAVFTGGALLTPKSHKCPMEKLSLWNNVSRLTKSQENSITSVNSCY